MDICTVTAVYFSLSIYLCMYIFLSLIRVSQRAYTRQDAPRPWLGIYFFFFFFSIKIIIFFFYSLLLLSRRSPNIRPTSDTHAHTRGMLRILDIASYPLSLHSTRFIYPSRFRLLIYFSIFFFFIFVF